MKPVRSVKNQYLGINAHLHSLWQSEGWNNFHNPHIVYLSGATAAQLRGTEYRVKIEESLQIRRVDEYPKRPKSDISIYDLKPYPPEPSSTSLLTGLVLPLPAILEDNPVSEKPYQAITIYEVMEGRGEPVVWIEVLSPSNKRAGDDLKEYSRKRSHVVESGIVFVELDYLHETPSTFPLMPDYTIYENQSHPYRIVLLAPRPDLKNGQASINEFDVDQPIPHVVIPLSGDEILKFDFNAPYQKQFEERFYGDDVDYAQFPLNFDRYSPADQARIAARMVTVLEKAQQGIDLETGPFAAETLPLNEALARIAALTNA
jgi:hypothetical protein